MVSVGEAGLARITLVAPRTRIDLALPTDVPLADLLPTLLHVTGNDLTATGDTATGRGWALSQLGGAALDSSRTPAQLQVHDGELLYLRPRGEEAPMLVFDDVIDAVATATGERTSRWKPSTTRLFGLGLGVAALLAGAIALPFTGSDRFLTGVVALSFAVVLLGVAVVLSRALGDSRAGVAFAATATFYAGIGGLLVLAGRGSIAAPHILIAVTAILLSTVLAAIGVADAAPLFLGIAITAVATGITVAVGIGFGIAAAPAASVVATIVFATMPLLPMLAYRLAGLPIPTVPTEPEELKRDNESVDGTRVLQRSVRADGLLTAMLGALGMIGGAAAILAAGMGTPGVLFALILGLILLSRARFFGSRAQRLWLLCCGAAAVAASSFAFFATIGYPLRVIVILAVILVTAAISTGVALARADRKPSPLWGRALDILEVFLILGLVPLAVWVSGLYSWIRAIRG
ncbi:MAG TPA: type VII secretion integral membrane protein EccD [Candidatus Limnocylindrales bacterium]